MVELQVEAGIYLHVVIQYSNESKKLVFLQNNQTCIQIKIVTN